MTIPTVMAKGQRGSWEADVKGFGVLPCVHAGWCSGRSYREPETAVGQGTQQRQRWNEKIANGKVVVMTKDANFEMPDSKRAGYVAVFRVNNVVIDERGLVTFDFIERLANCR
jgi:hypothetical protein